jgi:hypothetical protein
LRKRLSADGVTKYLKALDRAGFGCAIWTLRLRRTRLTGQTARRLERRGVCMSSLPVSDRSQMREFYLSKLEEVDTALRAKFQKLYQYY